MSPIFDPGRCLPVVLIAIAGLLGMDGLFTPAAGQQPPADWTCNILLPPGATAGNWVTRLWPGGKV